MTTPPPTQIGRYRIERELGRGTMGVVYEARDTALGRTVALKTFGAMAAIAPHEREAFELRFLSEARISATLDHENVVGVFDVGRDFQTGLLFMALEYVRGETLAEALARGPMPWEDAVRIVTQVARALQTAHAHHIVHRDIKPANIMLTPSGEPKIMDFGIAKASAAQLTVAGQVFGTPAYMSPEQASGEEVDGRSDIFSLGCVLYELVTNTRPFEGPTMAATLNRILREEPPKASTRAKIPHGLEDVIARALCKDRNSRYDSAAHLVEDLEALLEGEPPRHATKPGPLKTLVPPAAPRTPQTSTTRRTTPPSQVPPALPQRVSPTAEESAPDKTIPVRLVATLAIAGLVVVGGFVMTRKTPEVQGTPEPASSAPLSQSRETPPPPPSSRTTVPTPPVPDTAPAAVLSVGGTEAPARVTFDLRHAFGSASLRIKVDDRVVFANRLNGMPIRNNGVTTGYEGRFGADLVIPSGDRLIQVEVRSGEAAIIQSSRVRLRSGDVRRLNALVNENRTLTLVFEP